MAANFATETASPIDKEHHNPLLSDQGALPEEQECAFVGIVIVNWNGWKDTLRCIDSLSRLNHARWKAIVVDNASSDESLEKLRPLRDSIDLIESPTNTGWAGGNNIGIRHAFALGCDYVWLLNNDAVAAPDALTQMIHVARSSTDVAFVGSLIDHDPPRPTYQFTGTRVDPRSGVPEALWDTPRHEVDTTQGAIRTDYVMGCSLLASRRTVKQIGLIDEHYFLNYDETDWCRRATNQGMRCLLVPSALVRHRHSASIGGTERPLHRYFMIRNRLLYTKKYCTLRQRLYNWKLIIWEVDKLARTEGHRHWLVACLRRDTPLVRTAMIAVRDFLTGRRGDCPASVRALHADTARKSPVMTMQATTTPAQPPIEASGAV